MLTKLFASIAQCYSFEIAHTGQHTEGSIAPDVFFMLTIRFLRLLRILNVFYVDDTFSSIAAHYLIDCTHGWQVLSNSDKVFLRIANDRGWTYARDPANKSVLFEEIQGEVEEDG